MDSGIVGGEMRFHAVIVDIDASGLAVGALIHDLRATAPGQEFRIVLDLVDQSEHVHGAVRNEDRFPDALHRLLE
jgi:hypothetical protein